MEDKTIKNYLRWCIKIQQCKYCKRNKQCAIQPIKDKLIRKYFIHIDLPRKNVK